MAVVNMQGTNVVNDGSELMEGLIKILDHQAKKAENLDATKRGELMRKFADYLKLPGSTIDYHIVPAKFRDELEQRLQVSDIPYTILPTSSGSYMFLVGGNHKEEFLQAQYDVFSKSPDYALEVTAMHILNDANREVNGKGEAVKITIKDSGIAAIAKTKLIESQIVGGILDNMDSQEGAEIFIPKDKMFNKSGRDLAEFELRMALIQAYEDTPGIGSMDQIKDRIKVGEFDQNLRKEMVANIVNGKEFAFGSAGKNTAVIEFKGGTLMINGEPIDPNELSALIDSPVKLENYLTRFTNGIPDPVIVNSKSELKEAISNRPVQTGKMHEIANRKIDRLIGEISKRASEMVYNEYGDKLKPEEKYEKKKELMSKILSNPRAYGLLRVDIGKEEAAILATMKKHLIDGNEHSVFETEVDLHYAAANKRNRDDVARKTKEMEKNYDKMVGRSDTDKQEQEKADVDQELD